MYLWTRVILLVISAGAGSALTIYLTKTYHKTASLIAESCACVALLGGLSRRWVDWSHQLGTAIGIAFQLYDDELDITATSSNLGKPVLNDLRAGLATAPALMAALEVEGGEASAAARKLLHRGTPAAESLSEADIQNIASSIYEGAALPRARLLTALYVSRVIELLEVMVEYSHTYDPTCRQPVAVGGRPTGAASCCLGAAADHPTHAGQAWGSTPSYPSRAASNAEDGEERRAASQGEPAVGEGPPEAASERGHVHDAETASHDSDAVRACATTHAACGGVRGAEFPVSTRGSPGSTTAAATHAQHLPAPHSCTQATHKNTCAVGEDSAVIEGSDSLAEAAVLSSPQAQTAALAPPPQQARVASESRAPRALRWLAAALPASYRFITADRSSTFEARTPAAAEAASGAAADAANRVAASTAGHTDEALIEGAATHASPRIAAHRSTSVATSSRHSAPDERETGVCGQRRCDANTSEEEAAAAAEMIRTCCSGVAALLLFTLSRKTV